ncbi:hypothetical protein JW835_12655 [bacterium]|nr:hypothetical protein [bacterium]
MNQKIKYLCLPMSLLFCLTHIFAQGGNDLVKSKEATDVERLCELYNQSIEEEFKTGSPGDSAKYTKIEQFQLQEKWGYYTAKGRLFQSKTQAQLSRMGSTFIEYTLFSLGVGGVACLFSKNKGETFKNWSIGTFCIAYPIDLIVFNVSPIRKVKIIRYQGKWQDPHASGFEYYHDYWYRSNDLDYLMDWQNVRKSNDIEEWRHFFARHPDRYVFRQIRDRLLAYDEKKAKMEKQISGDKSAARTDAETGSDSDISDTKSSPDLLAEIRRNTSEHSLTAPEIKPPAGLFCTAFDPLGFLLSGPTLTVEFTPKANGKSLGFGIFSGYRCVKWGWMARELLWDDLKLSSYSIPIAIRLYSKNRNRPDGTFYGLYAEFGNLMYDEGEDEIIRAYGIEWGYKHIGDDGFTIELTVISGIIEYGEPDDLLKMLYPSASLRLGYSF